MGKQCAIFRCHLSLFAELLLPTASETLATINVIFWIQSVKFFGAPEHNMSPKFQRSLEKYKLISDIS